MNIPFFSKKNSKEYYFGIFLKEDRGVVMIFAKEEDGLELVDREKFDYTNGWENLTDDVDQALYKLEKNIKAEIKKTIFFVYSHLIDDKAGDIKTVYLQKVKQLVKALELKAMGYVECYEAVSNYLEKNEQSSLTGTLIEIDKTQLGIFVYKGGKLDAKINFARTDDILFDLSEGFEEIKKKTILPARIILYDSGNLDDTATKILSHRWSSELFIQMPKVDILSEDEVINGLMGIFGEQLKNERPEPVENRQEKETREKFGFLLNEDVAEKTAIEDEKEAPDKLPGKNKLAEFAGKIMAIFPKRNQAKPAIAASGKIFPVIGLVIILAGLLINEYFFHQAQLTVYLPTQVVSKSAQLETDYRLASASADFSETAATTGKQDIGDKARGSVTIHNFDDKEKVFSKSSVLAAANLKFLLDADVKVASASLTSDGSAKLPGQNSANITASVIGPDSNLAKNQRFTFDGLSSSTYFAINDSALSGGSKKQIQTVAKKDQDDLKAKILNKAKNSLPSIQISPEEGVAASLSRVDFSKLNFSNEIGEESASLTLKATVSATHYLYNKNDLADKILAILAPDVNSQYHLDKNNISYSIDKVSQKDNTLDIAAKIKGKAVINVSDEAIKQSLLGRNQSGIRDILKNQYKIDGYKLTIKEPLPFLNILLPLFPKNITIINSSL